MLIRTIGGAAIAAIALSTGVSAQTSRDGAPLQWQQMAQRDRAEASQNVQTNGGAITMIGCLEREADYRTRMSSGKGGALGTGAGLGNEFVLVTGDGGCSSGTGEAFELTGGREKELEPYVGLQVEVTGELKPAKIGDDGRPTGGVDPLGQDLRLREVEVGAFRDPVPPPAQAARADEPRDVALNETRQPAAPADPARDDDRSIGTAGQDDTLPRTASPLGAAGLFGALAFGGAAAVRALRRYFRDA